MKFRIRPSKLSAALAMFLATVLVAACGGGGGGGGSTPPPPPTPPTSGITYSAAASSPQESISLQRSNSGAMELILQVQANSVTNLYGVGFDLAFPADLLRFEDVTEEAFLDGGGAVSTSLLIDDSANGSLVVGLTRLGASPGRSGSGALLSLRFTAIASGNGSFQFSSTEAFDGNGGIADLSWSAGSVEVRL